MSEKSRLVIHVEDDETDRFIAKTIFDMHFPEYSLKQAKDGKEAIDLLKEIAVKPNLIILDINMPGMDGHRFLAEYSTSDLNKSSVVMLTSSKDEKDRNKILIYPFVIDYLQKPLLQDSIKEYLG